MSLPSLATSGNKPSPRQALLELIEGTEQRTKMGRFREVYDLVESAAKAGARRETILAKLRDAGLDLSPATLNSYLTRLRKQQPAPVAPATDPHPTPPQPAPGPLPAPRQSTTEADPRAEVEDAQPPGPVDFAAIRNRSHDLEALRRRWRKHEREEAAAAKASTSEPATPAVPTPGPAEPT